ncbi:MAG TPA: lipocalin-like domain-containing protein [bacterium]|nr:lipocalin-like domain-containing protein [bacterium]HPQ66321.1 lipocalin-like domain-containing protein [bacterium]
MERAHPLVGTWKLIAWENTDAEGVVSYPYGEHPIGYLLYTEDGYMAAEIMDPDRRQHDARFPVEPAFEQTLPDEDRRAGYDTYLSYCGTYTYSAAEGMVRHHIKAALIPSWTGNDQLRRCSFRDGKLFLTHKRARLVWERAADHA